MKKVKMSLYIMNYAPRHEDVWGTGSIAPQFLISVLDGGEWSASRPGGFTRGERDPTEWVDLRAVLDAMEKRRISASETNI
jgi:hypothetical protein